MIPSPLFGGIRSAEKPLSAASAFSDYGTLTTSNSSAEIDFNALPPPPRSAQSTTSNSSYSKQLLSFSSPHMILESLFNETGPRACFGVVVDKDGVIEYAIGQHTEEILGYSNIQLSQNHKSLVHFATPHCKPSIFSFLPSSNKTGKKSMVDFCNEKTKKVTNLEVTSKVFLASQSNEIGSQIDKTCVACVAKKPEDTFELFLEKLHFKIIRFEKKEASLPGIREIDFQGKTLKDLCKKNEWNTINIILETPCQRASELNFYLNSGISISCKVTNRNLNIDESIQLYCEVLKICSSNPHHHVPQQQQQQPASIGRTYSLMESQPSTSGIIDLNENKIKSYPHLNRTSSVPLDSNVNPAAMMPTNNFPSSPVKAPARVRKRKDTIDSVIDSVANNSIFSPPSSNDNFMMAPPQPMTRINPIVEEKGSILKTLLQNPSSAGNLGLPPGYPMLQNNGSLSGHNFGGFLMQQPPPTGFRQNSFDSSNMPRFPDSHAFDLGSSPEKDTKKKRQRNTGTKKLTK